MCVSGAPGMPLFFFLYKIFSVFFFFQAEDGIRDADVTGVQTCALPIYRVTFIDENGNILSVQMVEYGKGALEPDNIPTKPHSNTHDYSFQGWDKPFNYITEEINVQTVYLGAPRKYVYEFYLDDHTTLIKRVVGYYDDQIIGPSKSVI